VLVKLYRQNIARHVGSNGDVIIIIISVFIYRTFRHSVWYRKAKRCIGRYFDILTHHYLPLSIVVRRVNDDGLVGCHADCDCDSVCGGYTQRYAAACSCQHALHGRPTDKLFSTSPA